MGKTKEEMLNDYVYCLQQQMAIAHKLQDDYGIEIITPNYIQLFNGIDKFNKDMTTEADEMLGTIKSFTHKGIEVCQMEA